jgi:hypothetical protein
MHLLDAPASSLSLSLISSDILFGDRNPALLCADIADCWLRIQYSVRLIIRKLEKAVTHWNAILFQVAYGWYTDQSVYFHIPNSDEIITQWSLPTRLINFSINLIVQPVITYIYLCGRIYASCLSYISNHPSRIGQKMNWNVTQALEKPYTIGILSYTDSLCLVPFSSRPCKSKFCVIIFH